MALRYSRAVAGSSLGSDFGKSTLAELMRARPVA